MGRFLYQARTGQGELSSGALSAASIEEAGRMLRAEGKFVVKLTPTKEDEAPTQSASSASLARRIKRSEVIVFAHQMAVMIDTGVPLSESLNICAEQSPNEAFRTVLRDVADRVHAGGEFSAALRQYPGVFPSIMISLIRASEVSGTMGVMLERISKYLSREQQTLRQVRGALVYPCFMLVVAIGVTLFLLAFVLPKFAKIYESKNAVLPAPTRVLLAVSHGLLDYWYVWIGLVIVSSVTVALMRRSPNGRRVFDYLKLHVPVARHLFSQMYLSRATRTMGTMLASGVSMLDMIAIVREVTNNAFYNDLWDEVDQRLRQGSQLSAPLFSSPLIPKAIAQMVFSGEKSGRLGQVMIKVAEFTEEEFEQAIRTTTQFIEPAIIGFMGGMIGFVAISLLLPIFSVGRVMSGN